MYVIRGDPPEGINILCNSIINRARDDLERHPIVLQQGLSDDTKKDLKVYY